MAFPNPNRTHNHNPPYGHPSELIKIHAGEAEVEREKIVDDLLITAYPLDE
jgi:hypothetical protein